MENIDLDIKVLEKRIEQHHELLEILNKNIGTLNEMLMKTAVTFDEYIQKQCTFNEKTIFYTQDIGKRLDSLEGKSK